MENLFDLDAFIDALLVDMRMGGAAEEVRAELRRELELTFRERLMSLIVTSLSEGDLFALQQMRDERQDLDIIDILSIMVPQIPGLNELIVKEVDDFYEEMLGRARDIDAALRGK